MAALCTAAATSAAVLDSEARDAFMAAVRSLSLGRSPKSVGNVSTLLCLARSSDQATPSSIDNVATLTADGSRFVSLVLSAFDSCRSKFVEDPSAEQELEQGQRDVVMYASGWALRALLRHEERRHQRREGVTEALRLLSTDAAGARPTPRTPSSLG